MNLQLIGLFILILGLFSSCEPAPSFNQVVNPPHPSPPLHESVIQLHNGSLVLKDGTFISSKDGSSSQLIAEEKKIGCACAHYGDFDYEGDYYRFDFKCTNVTKCNFANIGYFAACSGLSGPDFGLCLYGMCCDKGNGCGYPSQDDNLCSARPRRK